MKKYLERKNRQYLTTCTLTKYYVQPNTVFFGADQRAQTYLNALTIGQYVCSHDSKLLLYII